MNKTNISWTDYSWNPVSGCSKVSPGCQNCYADALSRRWGRSFELTLHPEKLKEVKKIPRGSKVFVNSMSDLFHEKVPFEYIHEVMVAIKSRPDVIFQVLTKRPEVFDAYMMWFSRNYSDGHSYSIKLPDNLWLGVSVEMKTYIPRISTLQFYKNSEQRISKIFISFEPLLREVTPVNLHGVDWIIIGGESGPHHRPMKIEWARNLVKEAKAQGIPVWMKQMGGLRPGGDLEDFPEDLRLREFPVSPLEAYSGEATVGAMSK
ncbi:MAG: DUF5131 family protein [Thermoplasmatales archaeon]